MDCILTILKPPGMTSHDVVAMVRRHLRQRRVGHTGTLDPGAAGVLVLCIGRATRLISFMEGHDKGYRAELSLGRSTDTQDASGEVLREDRSFSIENEDFERVFTAFRGTIEQIPPMVSALKYKGQRLYKLARQGKVVERKRRPVNIHELSPVGQWRRSRWEFGDTIQFDVICSKGTYIRTLCEDIGMYLGVPAHMSFLLRTKVGPWSLEDVITLEEFVKAAEEVCEGQVSAKDILGLPGFFALDWGVRHLPGVAISLRAAERVRHGARIRSSQVAHTIKPEGSDVTDWAGIAGPPQLLRVYDVEGRFLGIGRGIGAGEEWDLQPVRVLPSDSGQ